MLKAALGFFLEVTGTWVIWSSYMAVKFMIECAQGQRASFSVHGPGSAGALVILPAFATVFWTMAVVLSTGSLTRALS